MTQKTLWGLLVAIILILLAMWAIGARTDDSATDTATTTATGGIEENLADGTYAIDTDESVVRWTGSKPRILGYEDSGTVKIATGTVTVAGGTIASGDFTIDMTTITGETTSNTKAGVDRLTTHLKSDDFFSVTAYPTARFVVTGVEDGMVTGDLTVKAATKEITFPATVRAEGDNRLVAEADITLDRTEWDIRYGSGRFFQDLGDNLIADEIKIRLELVATK